jgi:hypothetical protein
MLKYPSRRSAIGINNPTVEALSALANVGSSPNNGHSSAPHYTALFDLAFPIHHGSANFQV